MKIVGITGGIGSGKTTVCHIFRELGVPIYFADSRAKQLMIENNSLKEKIIQAFGSATYTNGLLNRPYLGEQVFGSAEKLSILNGLVHPVVAIDFEEWLEKWQHVPYVLKEAAILFESGAYQNVDITVLVIAPEKTRVERVVKRDNTSVGQVKQRMANQWAQERKAKLAEYIIQNDGTQLLIPQVMKLHDKFSSSTNSSSQRI